MVLNIDISYMQISKNNREFNISNKDEYSVSWFSSDAFKNWEYDTFHVLEHYKNEKKVFI